MFLPMSKDKSLNVCSIATITKHNFFVTLVSNMFTLSGFLCSNNDNVNAVAPTLGISIHIQAN